MGKFDLYENSEKNNKRTKKNSFEKIRHQRQIEWKLKHGKSSQFFTAVYGILRHFQRIQILKLQTAMFSKMKDIFYERLQNKAESVPVSLWRYFQN